MDSNGVSKFLKYFGVAFIIVSVMELIVILILSATEISIGQKILIQDLIYFSGLFPLSKIIAWIVFIFSTCCFLLLGIVILGIAKIDEPKIKILSKQLIVIGVFILIGCFFKLEYIRVLANTEINIGFGLVTFEAILYNSSMTPLYAAILWIFFSSVACGYLVIGLVIAAGGIQWSLEIDKPKKEKNDNS